ncbi:MAG: zinc ribbon domain-containing protein [Flavobacteriales bacterium]
MAKSKTQNYTVEEKLVALYNLQTIDSEIEQLTVLRGELPEEVKDLEDEIEGHTTRIDKIAGEIKDLEFSIMDRNDKIISAKALIKKYTTQQKNVRNNREFESLSKEIEFQELEIQLAEKNIKEFKAKIDFKNEQISKNKLRIEERTLDLTQKKSELDNIVAETQKDEEKLGKKQVKAEGVIDDRLLKAYKKLRGNLFNKLAVVKVDRDACGGCFAKVPPQRQLDIANRKKIIICEHCGRILVDAEIGA